MPLPIITTSPDAEPLIVRAFNSEYESVILGALTYYQETWMWEGEEADKIAMSNRIDTLIHQLTLDYVCPSNGGSMEFLYEVSLGSGESEYIISPDMSYRAIRITGHVRNASNSERDLRIQLNGETSANYRFQHNNIYSGTNNVDYVTNSTYWRIPNVIIASGQNADAWGWFDITFNRRGDGGYPICTYEGQGFQNRVEGRGRLHVNQEEIDTIRLFISADNFATGTTFRVWGEP